MDKYDDYHSPHRQQPPTGNGGLRGHGGGRDVLGSNAFNYHQDHEMMAGNHDFIYATNHHRMQHRGLGPPLALV